MIKVVVEVICVFKFPLLYRESGVATKLYDPNPPWVKVVTPVHLRLPEITPEYVTVAATSIETFVILFLTSNCTTAGVKHNSIEVVEAVNVKD